MKIVSVLLNSPKAYTTFSDMSNDEVGKKGRKGQKKNHTNMKKQKIKKQTTNSNREYLRIIKGN